MLNSYLRRNVALLDKLIRKFGSGVLDIGSDLDFLKPEVNDFGATYVGIKHDGVSFERARV